MVKKKKKAKKEKKGKGITFKDPGFIRELKLPKDLGFE